MNDNFDARKLSKCISHALRHTPKKYGLKLDSQGWVDIDILVKGIAETNSDFSMLTKIDIIKVVDEAKKRRHEIYAGKIRALYGHSLVEKIDKKETLDVPKTLFHGTTEANWASIRIKGLLPMKRQYVHLSAGIEEAKKVGSRRVADPVILRIDTIKAASIGVSFFSEAGGIWLSTAIPKECIKEIPA